MDEAHTQELERILQNRRSRGALLSTTAMRDNLNVQSPSRQGKGASSPARPRSAIGNTSVGGGGGGMSSIVRGQQVQSNMQYSPNTSVPRISYGNAVDDAAAMRRMLTQQEELRALQSLQERKVESLHGDIRRDLETVKSALFSVMQQQQQSSPRGIALSMPTSIAALNQQAIPQRKSFVAGTAFSSVTSKSALKPTNDGLPPAASGGKQIPLPIIFESSNSSQLQQTPSFSLRSMARTGAKTVSRTSNNLAPPEPPIAVRPLSSAPVDIASSVTILSSGDWFYKWNRLGNEVQPRFLWLDTSKYVLSWSRQQSRTSSFASYIKAEQISQVTTSQVVEHDELDRPRVFYVLLIYTDDRMLQLATEVREKLDVWYEAIGNLITYCRAGGPLTKLAESSE